MASTQGQPFTDFDLDRFSTRKAWSSGPLLVVVWRTECPTCGLLLPFIERMHKSYRAASVVGVVQNTPEEIADYAKENGLTMTNLPDTNLRISKFLKADIVPAYWLVNREGKVKMSGIGWDRSKIEELAQTLAMESGVPYGPIITLADNAPAFKPG